MTVVETEPRTWQEMAAKSRTLVEQVRETLQTKDGQTAVADGTQAKEIRTKIEEATQLATKAKELRRGDDAEYAKMLLEKFDLDDRNADSAWKAAAEGGQKSLISGSSMSDFDPLKQQFLDGGGSKDAELNPLDLKSRIVSTEKAMERLDIKALSEGTNSAGGYLVPPKWMQELFAETRRQGNALRRYGWLNVHPVTDAQQILLPRGGGAASVGWVAENATKPTADQTFSQVTVNIFTAAGISKLSKQLVDDSSPTAVDIATRELAALLGVLEEQAAIYGSGTGQPRGILNTTGVNAITMGTNTAAAIIDAILDAIVAITTTYYGAPNGILMHPRRLAFLQKAKDTNGQYLFNPSTGLAVERGPGGGGSLLSGQPMFDILGLPVGVSANVPTNIDTAGVVGGATGTANRDAIIIGDWNEAHWFQRQDQTLDSSDQAGTAFQDNQVWFRLEERAGFSAERYPTAFAVATGAGLVP